MNRVRYLLWTMVLMFAVTLPLRAQVSLTALNTASTQDFNTLISSGSGTWTDNSTIAGWYHTRTGSGNLIIAGTGSSNSGALYSFGASSSSERALGSVGSGNSAVGDLWWGVRLQNNTGSTITSLNISYIGEQWRYSGTAAAQTVVFSYQTGTNLTSLSSGSWTNVTALNFTSPVTSGSTGALDGNNATNRVNISSILSVTLNPGDEIMLRWFDDNHSGSDHGLAVDDFSVTAFGAAAPTTVEFALASSSFDEGAGTVALDVSVTNPSSSAFTQVDVVLTGGTATNGVDIVPAYINTTVSFAPNATNMTLFVDLFDDAIFEGNETIVFQLQNVSGGNNASLGAQQQHTMTILENDPPPTPRALVNEYYNAYGNISTEEAVELFVVEDGLDMRGWSISDATSGGTFPYATVTFSNDPLWNNLPAGTIIIIGGIYSVPIPDTDVSDGLILLQAPARGNSNQYFTGHSGGTLAFAGSSDALALFDATSTFVHGLAHGNNNQNTLPPGLHGWLNSSLSSLTSVYFTRSGTPMVVANFLENTYVDEGTESLANANDADGNRDFLRFLRSRTITTPYTLSGTFYWDVTVQGGTGTQSGPVHIGGTLFIEEGSYDNSGQMLALDASGNPENGAGLGNLTVGDDAGSSAVLYLDMNPTVITGAIDFNHSDATVEYQGTAPQDVLNAVYYNLDLRNGGQSEPKTVNGPVAVNGTLTIYAGTWLVATPPQVIELGPAGTYVNNGRFMGSIRSTRSFYGAWQDFGGIGITLFADIPNGPQNTATAVPGDVTVKMTSGERIWVGNLPSILRYYEITDHTPSSWPMTMIVDYAPQDLAGQNENNLGLHHSTNGGVGWSPRTATLNTGANTLTLDLADINGLWTLHANPPQGTIMSDPVVLYFETEENGPIPASQNVDVWNAYSNGSIIDWEALAAMVETPPWMTITPVPAEGINAGQFTVNITRSDLAPGTYTGTVTINDIHATNHPYAIPVTYRVYEPRKIDIGVDTLHVKVTYKRISVAANIPVMNGGDSFGPGEIAWTASSTTNWISLSNTSGMEGDAFSIHINAFHLPYGTYNGMVTIEGVNSVTNAPIVNSPLEVVVVLEYEPRTEVTHSLSSLPMGSSATFSNSEGHIIAHIEATSGMVQNLSLKLVPYTFPHNIHRLRYAMRHYIISATGSYSANMTLFYSLSELGQTGITEPWQLRLWRQIPALFSWVPYGGWASPLEQSVTGVGLTDLNGIWAMAYPFFPFQWEIERSVMWERENRARLTWTSDIETSDFGYMVERSDLGEGNWQTVAIVPPTESDTYVYREDLPTGAYVYRILTIDRNGDAWQSDDIELHPQGILDTDEITVGSFALGQTAPNPASRAIGTAAVEFSLPQATDIRLTLFDARGREIATLAHGHHAAGTHTVDVSLQGLTPGSYFYRLSSTMGSVTKKMIIVR